MFILLTISSSLLYYVEYSDQPEVFSSIPAAMWWGVATLTTVGYGDIYPITPLGKFLGAIISLLGIGLFALPAGILSAGFIEEIRKRRECEKVCP
ncbi:MAG: potassium channel family protein, partial [Candidatus Cloacimonadia bacterium]